MQDDDREKRKKFILIAIGMSLMFLSIIIIASPSEWTLYPGLLLGALLGTYIGYLLGKRVDFEKMQAKEPYRVSHQTNLNGEQKSWKWAIPLGVLVANISAYYFGSLTMMFLSGLIAGLICAPFLYLAVQFWRYRPK